MADSNSTIRVILKPEHVTWEDISRCLHEAHAHNREMGIRMLHSHWPAEQLKEYVGDKGMTFVILDGDKLIGTGSFRERIGKKWYAKGPYAFLCLDGIVPDYNGRGLYTKLCNVRETFIRECGYDVITLDTHENNLHLQQVAERQGFRKVNYFRVSTKDHFNVIMAKRLNGKPFPSLYCSIRFWCSKMKVRLSVWALSAMKRG